MRAVNAVQTPLACMRATRRAEHAFFDVTRSSLLVRHTALHPYLQHTVLLLPRKRAMVRSLHLKSNANRVTSNMVVAALYWKHDAA